MDIIYDNRQGHKMGKISLINDIGMSRETKE